MGPDGAALLMVVTVTTLLTNGQASRSSLSICDVRCCKADPSCEKASSITCNCTTVNQMLLNSRSFPKSVQTISIDGAQNVTIDSHAISHLHYLESLTISRVKTLHVKKQGLLLQRNSKLRTLSISIVQNATIYGSAFYGTWHNASIRMQSITTLSVKQNAFNYNSHHPGPSLAMCSVRDLDLGSNAFTAPVSRLFISHARMNTCPHNGFSKDVNSLLMNNVTINVAKAGCVNGDPSGMAQLSIVSCSLISVQTDAFSGAINEVLINDTEITSVQERGFQIQATNLRINSSYFDDLSSRGLVVSAKNSISLSNVTVRSLKRHALIGLEVDKSSNGHVQPLIIQALDIYNAENGSLAFAAYMPVCIDGLNVTRPQPPVCPTETWTRHLVGRGEVVPPTEAERQVYQQLVRRYPCAANKPSPPPTTGVDVHCTNAFDDPRGAGGMELPQGASGAGRADAPQGTGGRGRADTSHGAGESGMLATSSSPGVGDDISPGGPDQDPTGVGRTGEPDTAVGVDGGGGGGGRLALGLGVGVPLVLAAAATAAYLLVRRRRVRTATISRPPDDTQQTRGEHPQRRHHKNGAVDSRPPQRRPEPAGGMTASATTPQISDYAEVPMPGDMVFGDSDYAEIPGSDVYAEPVTSAGGGAPQYGDYAEIPGSDVYAEPVAPAGGGAPQYGEYAKIPPLDTVADGKAPEACDYAETGPVGQRDAGRTPGRVWAQEEEMYAEVRDSMLLSPPPVPGPGEKWWDSGEAPPLPSMTQERLQTPDMMLENELYVTAEEMTRREARGVTLTPLRD